VSALEDAPYPRALALFPEVRRSLLENFDTCGLSASFDIKYRQGYSTPPQARGTMFHRFAAECFRVMARQSAKRIPVGEALAILADVIRQDEVDRECLKCHSSNIAPGLVKGTWQGALNGRLRRCAACEHRFPTDFVNLPSREVASLFITAKKFAHDNSWSIENLVDVEQRLKAVIAYSKDGVKVERVFTGQLDALFVEPGDTHAIVIDHKDTFAIPAPKEVSEEGYFQQIAYAILVLLNYDSIQKVTLREFYPRFSETREAVVERRELADYLDFFGALIERFDRAVQEELWTPTPGKWCSYCPRPQACPVPEHQRAAGRIQSKAAAGKVAWEWMVGKATIEQTEEALKARCSLHGDIEMRTAKGMAYIGYRTSTTTVKPTPEQAAAAQRRGQDITELYRTRTSARFGIHGTPAVRVEDGDAPMLAALHESINEARAKRGIKA
jgi:hypothetical protein